MRIVTRVAVVAAALAGALAVAGGALASAPVRPLDGTVVHTPLPRFVVHMAKGDRGVVARVTAAAGSLAARTGLGQTACAPSPPAGHPTALTLSCAPFQPLPNGAYSWQLSFQHDVCRPATPRSTAGRTCTSQTVTARPLRFTVDVRPPSTHPAAVAVGHERPAPAGTTHIDPSYSLIASRIARKTATVRCWSKADWARNDLAFRHHQGLRAGLADALAYVDTADPSEMSLAPDVCALLDDVLYGGWRPSTAAQRRTMADAVLALAHESIHVFGFVAKTYGNEAETYAQCYGMQLMAWVAQQLGVDTETAADLAKLTWSEYPARYSRSAYYSDECRAGGKYDLEPGTLAFP